MTWELVQAPGSNDGNHLRIMISSNLYIHVVLTVQFAHFSSKTTPIVKMRLYIYRMQWHVNYLHFTLNRIFQVAMKYFSRDNEVRSFFCDLKNCFRITLQFNFWERKRHPTKQILFHQKCRMISFTAGERREECFINCTGKRK